MSKKFSIYNLIVLIILVMVSFCACESTFVLDTYETDEYGIYIPVAGNEYAAINETTAETNEPTEAHHKYNESYVLKPESEIVIGEKEFLTKINYIYNHIDLFTKSKIVVEGMYAIYDSWDGTFEYPMVYRNGPSCHGDDQYAGFFMINLPESSLMTDDWVKVEGTPFMYEHTDSEGEVQKFLFLIVSKIEKLSLKDRKQEMVNN